VVAHDPANRLPLVPRKASFWVVALMMFQVTKRLIDMVYRLVDNPGNRLARPPSTGKPRTEVTQKLAAR